MHCLVYLSFCDVKIICSSAISLNHLLQSSRKVNHNGFLTGINKSLLKSWGDGQHRSTAERSYPTPKARGSGGERQTVTAQERQRGATPHPRSVAAAERSNSTSKKQRLHQHRRAERSYSKFKVRRGGREEIPLTQSKDASEKLLPNNTYHTEPLSPPLSHFPWSQSHY